MTSIVVNLAPPMILGLVVLVLTINHGEAVVCYQCNSDQDPRCGDPFDPYSLGTINCTLRPRLDHLSNLDSTFCRKTSQQVYGKTRVVRECGYIKDDSENKPCLMRIGTSEVKVFYCACSEDLCNSTNGMPRPSIILPLVSLLMILLISPTKNLFS